MRLTSILVLLGATTALSQLRVSTPDGMDLHIQNSPLGLSTSTFNVGGNIALARSCPCDWPRRTPTDDEELLDGSLVLLPDGVCTESCSPLGAICTAAHYKALAVLFSCSYQVQSEGSGVQGTAKLFDDDYIGVRQLLTPDGCTSSSREVVSNETCSALPAAYILSNASQLLAAYASPPLRLNDSTVDRFANATANETVSHAPNVSAEAHLFWIADVNVSFIRDDRGVNDDDVDCEVYRYVPLVYLCTVPIWWVLTVLWTWNTYRANAEHARDLHRLLCWVPTIQFVHGILSLFNYSSCPWEGTVALVYATFWAVVTILKEPVFLLCLLLVAKGWCITRDTLHRREVCIAGTIVALLYAAVSIQLSLQSIVSLVPMVIMYLAMLTDIVFSILANLRILKAQLYALRAFGIDPRSTPVARKYKMFVRLSRFTALFVFLEVSIHIAFTGRHERFYWLFILLHQLMELVIAIGIGYTFRAQPFNVMFQQVQQVAAELADQLLPSITTVQVRESELGGPNLIAWRPSLDLTGAEAHLPATLVVLNPGDEEKPQVPASSSTSQYELPPAASTPQQQIHASPSVESDALASGGEAPHQPWALRVSRRFSRPAPAAPSRAPTLPTSPQSPAEPLRPACRQSSGRIHEAGEAAFSSHESAMHAGIALDELPAHRET